MLEIWEKIRQFLFLAIFLAKNDIPGGYFRVCLQTKKYLLVWNETSAFGAADSLRKF